ncbi:hypothetical protein SRB5_38430 [Streptomyces sp. RB5]|uniref:Glutamine amidotransferase domain-containing protein n=1 Tax=Streptomyces smaragdinus TaxID=2585196 RepID=A0A7K0CKC8_9ACTN|nr:type 1 glutamine amidotransferase [Streptomyces smaragdinus]MQY13693.1 hypothetical protein [Streptomyces smaragdinus]
MRSNTSVPRVLVVQNGAAGGPRRLRDWLTEDGVGTEVVHAYEGESLPADLGAYDALIVLGGGAMPDDTVKMPWLAQTRVLADQALAEGTPYLGICLGGQLLAQAAGGTVEAECGAPELGSTRLTLREPARGDRLFAGLPPRPTAIERHVDRVTELPPDAVWLAESDDCPYQAFRCGENAWGLQFHPEVDAERVREWLPEPIREAGFDPEEIVERADRDEPEAAVAWRELTRRFAEVVRGGTPVKSAVLRSPGGDPRTPSRAG